MTEEFKSSGLHHISSYHLLYMMCLHSGLGNPNAELREKNLKPYSRTSPVARASMGRQDPHPFRYSRAKGLVSYLRPPYQNPSNRRAPTLCPTAHHPTFTTSNQCTEQLTTSGWNLSPSRAASTISIRAQALARHAVLRSRQLHRDTTKSNKTNTKPSLSDLRGLPPRPLPRVTMYANAGRLVVPLYLGTWVRKHPCGSHFNISPSTADWGQRRPPTLLSHQPFGSHHLRHLSFGTVPHYSKAASSSLALHSKKKQTERSDHYTPHPPLLSPPLGSLSLPHSPPCPGCFDLLRDPPWIPPLAPCEQQHHEGSGITTKTDRGNQTARRHDDKNWTPLLLDRKSVV